jgi:mono/diheme cytochrome c family protein
MRLRSIGTGIIVVLAAFCAANIARAQVNAAPSEALSWKLLAERSSPTDLKVSGDLARVPRGETRFLTREDLLAISQAMTITPDDGNFEASSPVKGVRLEDLARALGAPVSDTVIAICKDRYRGHYPRAYVAAHHPILVLELNGKPLSDLRKGSDGHDPGPYLIAHVNFKPAFRILSHGDEPQVPWGVVRLEFLDQNVVFNAIEPSGPVAHRPGVQDGYRIARQNCFHCHNADDEGGRKSGVTWAVLSALAVSTPDFFKQYVRDPKSKSLQAQMPGNPQYDDRTLQALTEYFRSFSKPGSL